MKVNYIHNFDSLNEENFINIQNSLKEKIDLNSRMSTKDINICAGVDIAYFKNGSYDYGACSIVVMDYKSKKVIEKSKSVDKILVPYIPGFLAFREIPLFLEAYRKLTYNVDLVLFDGNGYLHPNHMGLATHASFFIDKPTIGIAKSYLKIKNTEFTMPQNFKGAYSNIVIDDEIYGTALRTTKNIKPVFISCGNYINLHDSINVVMNLVGTESRIPAPTRLADLETHILREEIINENKNLNYK